MVARQTTPSRPSGVAPPSLHSRMPFIDTNHQRAAILVLVLGVALLIALTPYATGLIGIPVLYAVFAPAHDWLAKRASPRLAASLALLLALFLIVSLFGLFYLLLRPGETWAAVRPYIPFSAQNTEKLRQRFRDVTTSTIIGTGLTAAIQGTLVGLGFALAGIPNALFWGVVTMVFAILPVVGSGLVWAPAALALYFDHRYGAAIGLAVWGAIVVGNVDYVIRPMVFRRWANIHPLVTLIG